MYGIFTYIYHTNQPTVGKYMKIYHTRILWECEVVPILAGIFAFPQGPTSYHTMEFNLNNLKIFPWENHGLRQIS